MTGVLLTTSSWAWPVLPGIYGGPGGAAFTPLSPTFPCVGAGSYASFSNGWSCANGVPILVFGQDPTNTSVQGGYADLAHAAVGVGAPIFFGQPQNWPTGIATDGGTVINALKAANAYFLPNCGDTSANSASNTTGNVDCSAALNNRGTISNMAATAATYGYTKLIGVDAGDEPGCGSSAYNGTTVTQPQQSAVAAAISFLNTADSTRIALIGQGDWVGNYKYNGFGPCGLPSPDLVALTSPNWVAFDYYPLVNANENAGVAAAPNVAQTDGMHPYDGDWATGAAVKAALEAEATEGVTLPLIATVVGAGDALASAAANWMHVTTNGTTTITIRTDLSPTSQFYANLDLTPPGGTVLNIVNSPAGACTDIPAGTHFSTIGSTTSATMNNAATGSHADCLIELTGGTATANQGTTSCNISTNTCASNGNGYRALPADTMADVMGALVNGANGIQYFCHDTVAFGFCLGETGGGAAALAAQSNLTSLDAVIQSYNDVLNRTPLGRCSPQNSDRTVTTLGGKPHCTNGIITVDSSNANCPIQARLGQRPANGHYVLMIMPDRESYGGVSCPTAGATGTVTMSGLGNLSGSVGWDSNKLYDAANDKTGNAVTVTSGVINVTLGANSDGYETEFIEFQ